MNRPEESLLETLYTRQIRKSQQFSQTLALYDMHVLHHGGEKSYARLHEMVDAFILNKNQENQRDERDRQFANAASQSSKITPKAGECRQAFYKGRCSRGNDCPNSHDQKGKGKGKKGNGKGFIRLSKNMDTESKNGFAEKFFDISLMETFYNQQDFCFYKIEIHEFFFGCLILTKTSKMVD